MRQGIDPGGIVCTDAHPGLDRAPVRYTSTRSIPPSFARST